MSEGKIQIRHGVNTENWFAPQLPIIFLFSLGELQRSHNDMNENMRPLALNW
jgi:hypothetical protein